MRRLTCHFSTRSTNSMIELALPFEGEHDFTALQGAAAERDAPRRSKVR